MIGIGLVGIGFMGMIHYLAAQRIASGRIVAVCSRDRGKLEGDWTSIQGNFGPRGQKMDLSQVAKHTTFESLLTDESVQLVDLCVPNDQHADLAIRALRAGKDVLVEKPIAVNLDDADRMISAARETGRTLLVAHVLPFFPEFAFAIESAASARFGKILAAHFTRVISRPDWSATIGDAQRTGGPAIDLHIHDTHFISLLFGAPTAVHSRGVIEHGAVTHLTTQYFFDGAETPAVSAVAGALVQPARPFAHGFEIYFEDATLSLGIADDPRTGPVNPFIVIGPDCVSRPEIKVGDPVDAFAAELENAVSAILLRQEGPLSASLARAALATCIAEVRSAKSGKVQEILSGPSSQIPQSTVSR